MGYPVEHYSLRELFWAVEARSLRISEEYERDWRDRSYCIATLINYFPSFSKRKRVVLPHRINPMRRARGLRGVPLGSPAGQAILNRWAKKGGDDGR